MSPMWQCSPVWESHDYTQKDISLAVHRTPLDSKRLPSVSLSHSLPVPNCFLRKTSQNNQVLPMGVCLIISQHSTNLFWYHLPPYYNASYKTAPDKPADKTSQSKGTESHFQACCPIIHHKQRISYELWALCKHH